MASVSQSNTAPGRPWKVLIADDDIQILALVRKHLSQKNVQLLETSDGAEALKLASDQRPDLVILDVMMPSMTGWEVCRAIRQEPSIKHTAVVMLTGIGERLNEMTSPLYGADDCLDKPFDFAEFDKRVNAVLEKKYQAHL